MVIVLLLSTQLVLPASTLASTIRLSRFIATKVRLLINLQFQFLAFSNNRQLQKNILFKGLIPDSAKESIGPQSSVQVHAPPPPQQMAPPPPVTVVSMQPPQPVPVPQPQPVAIMQMRPPPQMVVPAQQMFMAPAPPHIPSFGM